MAPVVHPGRFLKREMEARKLSANRLSLDIGVPSGRTDLPMPRDKHPRAGHAASCVQRVQQSGRGQFGCPVIAEHRGQPGLGQAGNRCLGHYQNGRFRPGVSVHDSAARKSRPARNEPVTEPETLDRPPNLGR